MAIDRESGQAGPAVLTAVAVILLIVGVAVSIRSYDTSSDVEAAGRSATPTTPGASGSGSQGAPSGAGTTPTTATGSVLTADTRSLLPVPPRDELASLTGREVVGRAAPVESVVADEGFWVGTSASDRIFVFLTPAARGTPGESPFTVRAGQRVELRGTLRALSGEPSSLGVDEPEGASVLRSQGHYVEATSVRLSG
ncbi:MAG: hypothetical protein M3314_09395 [Actinomycetota bacterium]|nr:hypothetical protein [Actinomycetota bacterium]